MSVPFLPEPGPSESIPPEVPPPTGSYPPAVAAPATGSYQKVTPYQQFPVDPGDLENTGQLDALRADPEIGGFLTNDAARPWDARRVGQALAGFVATAAAIFLLYLFYPGGLFTRYTPPVPEITPKPQQFPNAADLSILYRENVRDINRLIAGDRQWQQVFEKLAAFIADDEAGKTALPQDLSLWSREEMLLVLASKELLPAAFPENYPDTIYAQLEREGKRFGVTLPFRAEAAYVRLLADRPLPKKTKDAVRTRATEVLAVLERLRENYPELLDKNRDLLLMEAEQHINLIPKDYSPGDRYLEHHWRRAAATLVKLYTLYGQKDRDLRQLDRKRWQAVLRYFDFTLFTWDTSRMGRLKSVRLDGRDYTRDEIRRELEKIK